MLLKKNKKLIKIKIVRICILCTFNNTFITVTNLKGDVLFKTSSGQLKKNNKNLKKNTILSIQETAFSVTQQIKSIGVTKAFINLKGFGLGRYNTLKIFSFNQLNILKIFDETNIPFNGCRLKKKRRL